jgi:hypothetical protein
MHLCAPSFIRHWYYPHQPPLFSNLLWLCTIWRVASLFQTCFPSYYFNLLGLLIISRFSRTLFLSKFFYFHFPSGDYYGREPGLFNVVWPLPWGLLRWQCFVYRKERIYKQKQYALYSYCASLMHALNCSNQNTPFLSTLSHY